MIARGGLGKTSLRSSESADSKAFWSDLRTLDDAIEWVAP